MSRHGEHGPTLVSIESVFFNENVSSCISTTSVIAVVELASVWLGIPTLQIKSQAVKSAVKRMVNKLLRSEIRNGHEADAAAAAIAGLLLPLIVL